MKSLKTAFALVAISFFGFTNIASAGNIPSAEISTFYISPEDCEPTPPTQASEPFAPLAIMAALAGIAVVRRRKNVAN